MSKFEKFCIVYSVICFLSLFVGGCGSELADIAGGAAGGIGIKNTLEGMQADLKIREQALVARYNELVEAGAKAETLEQVKRQIAETQLARQGTQTVKETDWADPVAAGGGIGTIAALAYAWYKRKELNSTSAAVRAIRATADESTKKSIDQAMLNNKAII